MSTEIKTIKGSISDNVETSMILNRFYGGHENGSMLQLTLKTSEGYIRLTKEQSIELARALLNSFDYGIYLSE